MPLAATYYVYTLNESAHSLPFYVGKGKRRRCWVNIQRVLAGKKAHNPKLHAKLASLLHSGKPVCPQIVFASRSEAECFSIEKALIAAVGKQQLCNFTDGGDGCCGYSRVITAEHRARLSSALKGKKVSMTTRQRIKRARANQPPAHTSPHSDVTKALIRQRLSSPLVREKIGAANRGRTKTKEELRKQREANRIAWQNPVLLQAAAERARNRWKELRNANPGKKVSRF